ncbi:MAG: hypothetical protein ACREOO_05885 [bacterium]
MKSHIRTLGWLYIAFGVLGLVVALGFITALTNSGTTARIGLPLSTSGFGEILAAMFTLTSVPSLIGGIALLLRQSWAKTLVLILGFVNLSIIPVGMILSIYTIWVIVNEKDARKDETEAVAEDGIVQVFPPYH